MATDIFSRDNVKLVDINSLDLTDAVSISDNLIIGQEGGLKRTTAGDIFDTANAAALEAVDELSDEIYSVLTGFVDRTSNQSIAGVKTFTEVGSAGAVLLSSPSGSSSHLRFNDDTNLAFSISKTATNTLAVNNSTSSTPIIEVNQAGALTLTSSNWSVSESGNFTGKNLILSEPSGTQSELRFNDGSSTVYSIRKSTAGNLEFRNSGSSLMSLSPVGGLIITATNLSVNGVGNVITNGTVNSNGGFVGPGALTAGAQTFDGVKTFSSSPIVPTVATNTNNTQAASTAFVRNTHTLDVDSRWNLQAVSIPLTTSTLLSLTIPSPDVNVGGGGSTTGFTAPVTGFYLYDLYISLVGSTSIMIRTVVGLRVDALDLRRRDQIDFGAAGGTLATRIVNLSGVIRLTAGQVLRPQVQAVFTSGTVNVSEFGLNIQRIID